MMKRTGLAAVAMAAGVWCSAANAQCPDDGLQIAVNNYYALAKPDADVPAILGNIDNLVAACPADPHLLKIAATTYATGKVTDAKESVARLAHARQLFEQMWDNLNNSSVVRPVMTPDGATMYVDFNNLHDLEGQVRNLLFQAEQVSGVLAAEDMPAKKGAPPRACRSSNTSNVQWAYFWIKDKGDHPGAWNLMDRLIGDCEAELAKGRYINMLAQRASAFVASVKRTPAQPDALKKLLQAKADSERYVALNGGYYIVYWSESDEAELLSMLATAQSNANAIPPKEKWFVEPLLSDPVTVNYIAMALDQAWAKDMEVGVSGGYKNYVGIISSSYATIKAQPDPMPGRALLFKAAKAHASGAVRAKGNEGLKEPPVFLYNWIDPNYVPPKPKQ
ncbi:MAG: hypothetical protein R3C52_14595 [Hyphomonadaceae bacterium]